MQIFLADDGVFIEEDCIKIEAEKNKVDCVVSQSMSKKNTIRIDFGEKPCALILHKIVVKDKAEKVLYNWSGDFSQFISINDISFVRYNDCYYAFCTGNDPFIVLPATPENTEIASISIEVERLDSATYYNIIADKENIIADKENIIADKENIIADKENIIADKENVIANLCGQLDLMDRKMQALLNSKSWRITKPLRILMEKKIMKKLKKLLRLIKRTLKSLKNNGLKETLRRGKNKIRNKIAIRSMKKKCTKQQYTENDFFIDGIKYFDVEYYYTEYPDVKDAGIDALDHYLQTGWKEKRNPSENFDGNFYLSEYADVRQADICPLLHFVNLGYKENKFSSINEKQTDLNLQIRQKLGIVPFFHDYYTKINLNNTIKNKKIAVHLHLYYIDMMDYFIQKLNNISVPFVLFISISDGEKIDILKKEFLEKIECCTSVVIQVVANQGRDIAPLIITFGKNLLKYDYICHIHSKKSPHYGENMWLENIVDSLLGSISIVNQNFNLLSSDAKIIFNEPNQNILLHSGGWSDNKEIAKQLLKKYTQYSITDYPVVDFPQGSMFWAKSNDLKKFLTLPLTYDNFPSEPIPFDGTIAHALERLILIFLQKSKKKAYCIYRKNYPDGLGYYENQEDFSEYDRTYKNVKILSYYLPQFNTNRINDKWHGEGFTEWTKVADSNPLFYGHYQQHSPHKDLGYYHLTSPEVLRKQASMMKKSCVYGQIFYHYWFNGELILEKPAQMLLENKDIEMPFCFCWANENWTKKWDGNDAETILDQEYSREDALAFIKYLIPFFMDKRYIKVEGRPVLYIYRPALFPNFSEYRNIWTEECNKRNIEPLFLVACLTRTDTSPKPYGMDAAVERVLHDWTAGNCLEQKNSLSFFNTFTGTVLDYNDVASYYETIEDKKDFTWYRSIVPNWDNTARYKDSAHIVHNSNPIRFQKWIEQCIDYTVNNLPQEQQFVVVNAWNEWAEGAHLEPDSKFGYAYLNSVGRSLVKNVLSTKEIMLGDEMSIPEGTVIWIQIHELALKKFVCAESKEKMFAAFKKITIFDKCTVKINNFELYTDLKDIVKVEYSEDPANADYILQVQNLVIFAPDTFEKMLKMILKYPFACIMSNLIYKGSERVVSISDSFSTQSDLDLFPVKLYKANTEPKSYKIRIDAMSYLLSCDHSSFETGTTPVVSTVIRFHKNNDYQLLERALFSLVTQASCIVQPMLMLQDVSETGIKKITEILNKIEWSPLYPPQINIYKSQNNDDLRSKMLNVGFLTASNKYITFLDYDDFMYPFAYSWLIKRLITTGKAVSYGLVYATDYNLVYEYVESYSTRYSFGSDYKNFLINNHAPIHSLMINRDLINKEKISYFDNHKYMEDYYLLLQIITKNNADWDALSYKQYIGDYMHFKNCKVNTLATQSNNILKNEEFIMCKKYIDQLRQQIIKNTPFLK
ncbi:MAG: glycoside hydrolase family 99-like domain-containing protein [Treponemataceae bacterium]